MFLRSKHPNQHQVSAPSSPHVQAAAIERLAELSEYCARDRLRAGGTFEQIDQIARDMRRVQSIAPRYAELAPNAPEAQNYLSAIMTDAAITIAKVELRKENQDRINAPSSRVMPASSQPAGNSEDSAATAALFAAPANLLP